MLKRRFWKNFDWILLAAVGLLLSMGLIVIYSTSFKATSLDSSSDVVRQGVFVLIGLIGMLALVRIDYRMWGKMVPWIYWGSIGLLLLVELVATPVLGAKRWIDLGFFQFQPSEIMKLALIIALAKLYADNYDQLYRPKFFFLAVGYIALPALLVFKEPDLGSTLVLCVTWLAMTLVSRIRKAYLMAIGVVLLALAPVGYALLKPFQKARLATFLDPAADPTGTGYNVSQSIITVGSGQLFGRGLAAGSQTQLNFLPSLAQHTDFIFAVLAEKLGFVGAGLLIILFGVLMARGIMIAHNAQDRFGMFIAIGLVAMYLFHFFINVGMNIGIAPVTGIPLPFVSYGGTSLVVAMLGIGLLESIAVRRKKLQFEG